MPSEWRLTEQDYDKINSKYGVGTSSVPTALAALDAAREAVEEVLNART